MSQEDNWDELESYHEDQHLYNMLQDMNETLRRPGIAADSLLHLTPRYINNFQEDNWNELKSCYED
jgi:hypothetical protein